MPVIPLPIKGFAPDLPPDTPGIIVDSSQIVPTINGVAHGYGLTSGTTAAATGPSLGAASLTQLNGTSVRDLIGVATKLYEVSGGAFTDVSGATYAATTTDTWSFTQFGSVALAVNKQNNLQASTAALSAFATVSGAPKASIVITCGEPNASFVMCFDYNDGVNNYTDGIFWSALTDYTNWTPSIATECGNLRLTDISGDITAAAPYRDGVVAFKARGMYLGTYVGGSDVWDWQRISADVGCIGKNAVIEADDVLYFCDSTGFWMYDGSYPRKMHGYVHDYWRGTNGGVATKTIANFTRLTWDKPNHRIWCGCLASGQTYATYLCFNTRSGLWTNHGTITDSGGAHFMREMSADLTGTESGTTFGSYSLTNTSASAPYFRMSAMGSPYGMTFFKSVRPTFISGPTDSMSGWLSGTLYYGPSLRNVTASNVAMSVDATSADNRADRLDVQKTARYLSPKITVSAGTAFECTALSIDAAPGGAE